MHTHKRQMDTERKHCNVSPDDMFRGETQQMGGVQTKKQKGLANRPEQTKNESCTSGRMSDSKEGCIVGVETGGEHMVVAAARADRAEPAILERWECATTRDPAQTLADVRALVERAARHGPLRAVGVASFGPIDPEPASPTYGCITSTPKPGWRNTDVLTALGRGDPQFAHVCFVSHLMSGHPPDTHASHALCDTPTGRVGL